jgi:WD40 repeat protein/serine/threonine protein kinase
VLQLQGKFVAMIETECPTCTGVCDIPEDQVGNQIECPYCEAVYVAEERQAEAVSAPGIIEAVQDDIQRGQMSISAFMQQRNIDGGVELQKEDDKKSIGRSSVIQTGHSDRYNVGKVVAQGGMGAILRAKDLNCRRPVAMKVMLADKEATDDAVLRFIEEAQITAQLEHPNIVPLHELGVDASGNVFYTMKMVKGTTLDDILVAIKKKKVKTVRAYPLQRLLTIFMRVCDAIAFANSKGVIHRDLKPENIMVGEFGEVLVMDWGLAKVLGRDVNAGRVNDSDDDEMPEWVIDSIRTDGHEEATKTMQGDILGTPAFMAPEQAMGKIDQIDTTTDIYALGGILYNILTLATPIKAAAIHAMLLRLTRGDIPPPAERVGDRKLPHLEGGKIPSALSAVAMKALALNQCDRYQSVQEFQSEIEAWQGGFATEAEDASSLQVVKLALARHKKEVALAAMALLMLAVGTGIAFWRVNAEKQVAQQNAVLAQKNADEATMAKEVSEQSLAIAERSNYISQINLAQANIVNGNYDAARAILESCPEEHRHFEWDRLNLLTDIGDQLFQGHRQSLDSVNFNSDGSKILTSSKDGTAKLWDTVSGRMLVTFRDDHRIRIRTAAISPSGKYVVTGNYDSMIKVWDATTGKEIRRLEGVTGNIESVVFSPDGKQVAGASNEGTAAVWGTASGKRVQTFELQKKFTCVRFSPDGQSIATASPDGARIWDVASGKQIAKFGACFAVAFSPDGRELSTVALQQLVQWDISTRQQVWTSQATGFQMSVEYSRDGTRLLTGTEQRTFLWDAESGQKIREFNAKNTDRCSVAFSPDGKRVLTGGDPTATIWNTATGTAVRTYTGSLEGAALAEQQARGVKTLKGHPKWVWTVDFSPDGKRLASGSALHRLIIWDPVSGTRLHTFNVNGYVFVAEYSPDGKRLVANGGGTGIQILDAVTGGSLGPLRVPKQALRCADWSADGKYIVTGGEDNIGRLWDAATKKVLKTFKHEVAIRDITFSPDGKQVVTASDDRTAVVWDRASGKKLLTIEPGGAVYSVAFSPDGKYILTGATHPTVKLWDATDGSLVRTLEGHGMTVSAVTFSPDGQRILTGSYDRTAKLWDTATGKELISFEGHTNTLTSVAFSPDGRMIATGAADYLVKVWYSEATTSYTLDPMIARKRSWRVIHASSESSHNGNVGSRAIDSSESTIWHSKWWPDSPSHPHELHIDFGKELEFNTLTYVPRSDRGLNGTITNYELYLSADGKNWGSPAHTGTFDHPNDRPKRQVVRLPKKLKGRYLRFLTRGSLDGEFACVAELDFTLAD